MIGALAAIALLSGEPFFDTEFSVTEGTWMSVDVSPDGKTLAFDMLGDIYQLPASGGEAVPVHSGPAMQRAPRYSGDGSRLLYLSDESGSDNAWVSNADGSNARQITHESVDVLTGPSWGPTAQSIVAARMESIASKLHSSELRLYDIAGGKGQLIVGTPANTENAHEARFSGEGRWLYYTEKVSAPHASVVYIDANHINYAIKRRDMHTGDTEEIVSGFGSATTPELSRDGKRMAFVRRVKDKTVLFVYDLTTRVQRPVYDALDRDDQADFIAQGTYYPSYAWFPDNRHVAIWAKGKLLKIDMDSGTNDVIPFRATSRHRITTAPRFTQDLAPETFRVRAIRHLSVAPDGKQLVFSAIGHLWHMTLPNTKPTRLTKVQALEFEPAWSPDGQQIAFVDWSDEKGGAIRIASTRGRVVRTLVSGSGVMRQPAFSPDDKRIVYKIDEGDSCMGGSRGKPGLYWIAATGGESHFITRQGNAPQFSPDGQRVYFTTERYADGNMINRLESVNLDGFDWREHARTVSTDTQELRPSPDLRWIGFRERQQYYVVPYREIGTPIVVSASSNAVPVRALTDVGGYGLTWSADSTTVHWTLGPQLFRAKMGEQRPERLPETYAEVDLQIPSDKPQGKIAFVNGRLLTLNDEEVIERGTIVVDSNRIVAIGSADAVPVPKDAKVIDVSGKTLMPGLVNMHGHVDDCYYSSAGLMPEKRASHYASLAFGTTTNYDPYSSELATYSQSEMNRAGVSVGLRSITVGSVIYGREGKTDYVYVPINSVDDARKVMVRKRALGGTIIKSYRQPARAQRQQLIRAAREAEVMVDIEGESHFYNNITMVLDGHTALEHNLPVANYYDDVVQLFARGQTANTPTLIVTFGEIMGENYFYERTRVWEDPRVQAFVPATTSSYSPLGMPHGAPPYARGMTTIHVADELWDIGFRSVARSIKKLDDAGVIINVGSHGQIHGIGSHWEMWLLAEGGMSNLHVLRAATLNGARTLGLDKQIGSLEAGKLADLIVLDANSLADIHNSSTVKYTMVNGRLYDSLTMTEIGNRP